MSLPGTVLDVETPLVNGLPTTLSVLTRDELAVSPLLEPLVRLTNAAFAATHGPPYFLATAARLPSSAALISGLDEKALTYILTQTLEDGEVRVLGSVTDEPYRQPLPGSDDAATHESRPHLEGEEGREYRRALRLLVTDLTLHRQGVGSFLLSSLEQRLIQEAERIREETGSPLTHVRWILDTVADVNAGYYERRGWRLIDRKLAPPVPTDCGLPIYVAYMDRVLELSSPTRTQ
ncbi:hypothetical protein EXIGLDRAFT_723477 [Exidia glandulosa HHB12029]|uniref:N-acetyltransferase domain-containing protein n=1 Tax=Exidia glandulosa HHB12029 TaxID=1314781 RepID=A0A165ETB7_EXIGL|nr:hypothetical protein EXIGLDRAFT_723477 [Exidia glandulosa HHB12029]